MKEQGYKIIRSDEQYYKYCDKLEELVNTTGKGHEDDIELLTILIEKYDAEKIPLKNEDPIGLIKIFMNEHNIRSKDLAEILDVNKSTVSRILNYKKGLSKNAIRILAKHFAISQEALNRPYRLRNKTHNKLKNASLMTK
jgi:HTH-type transcriptional regulator/antitoxin HigA